MALGEMKRPVRLARFSAIAALFALAGVALGIRWNPLP